MDNTTTNPAFTRGGIAMLPKKGANNIRPVTLTEIVRNAKMIRSRGISIIAVPRENRRADVACKARGAATSTASEQRVPRRSRGAEAQQTKSGAGRREA